MIPEDAKLLRELLAENPETLMQDLRREERRGSPAGFRSSGNPELYDETRFSSLSSPVNGADVQAMWKQSSQATFPPKTSTTQPQKENRFYRRSTHGV